MSNIRLNIQMFGGSDWSSGISKEGVQDALEDFNKTIKEAQDHILAYSKITSAFQSGWSGQDCQDYLTKFYDHAKDVNTKIEAYRVAVGKEAQNIIDQWDTFQKNLIS